MMTTIGEYLDTDAIRQLTVQEITRTKVWTPVFGRAKKDTGKIRLITDIQHFNQCHQVPRHKAESWTSIQETVGKKGLNWGITLDLKGFFHHLQMNITMQRWMRFQFNQQSYQIQAMPFGWALSPWWANKFTKPIKACVNNLQWDRCGGWTTFSSLHKPSRPSREESHNAHSQIDSTWDSSECEEVNVRGFTTSGVCRTLI